MQGMGHGAEELLPFFSPSGWKILFYGEFVLLSTRRLAHANKKFRVNVEETEHCLLLK